jgi:hypothetical protein
MHNYSDWALQPGAPMRRVDVETIDLQ